MLRSFYRLALWQVCFCVLLLANASPQELANHALPVETAAASTSPSTSALTTSVSLPQTFQAPAFTGSYAPDGTFKRAPKGGKSLRGKNAGFRPVNSPYAANVRPAPEFMDLHSIEHVVQNYEPPAHATEQVKGHSFAGNLRDNIVTLAYGREWVLMSPTRVTTDSRQRLIIADPEKVAVHVLEPKAKGSFRIAGGPRLRLRAPSSVAVDKDDNIYVGDLNRGVVLVFNPEGNYLRTIGQFAGESMFQAPAAIAIDRRIGRLYVLDKPMRELFVLDLSGRLIDRIGGPRDKSGQVRFEDPTHVAAGTDRIVVLDAGARIRVLRSNGTPLATFPVPNPSGAHEVYKNGLALDSAGNIYLSNPIDSTVEVLTPDGQLLGTLGHPGADDDCFSGPSGLWIDASDRMYVADTANRRVQTFQLNSSQQLAPARPVSVGGND